MDYALHIIVIIGIYGLLSVSLYLPVAQAGLLSVAQAAFFGLGAYVSAILSTRYGTPFAIEVFFGGAVSAACSLVVSLAALRLREDYFVIGSLWFQVIVSQIFSNWVELTRGPLGIPGIPPLELPALGLVQGWAPIMLSALIVGIGFGAVAAVVRSPFGRILRAIREDEWFVASLGKSPYRAKTVTLMTSGALAGVAGSFYARYVGFVDPTSFTINESIYILSMVILGGERGPLGALWGAVGLTSVPEVLRYVGFSSQTAGNVRQMLYGCVLCVAVIFLRENVRRREAVTGGR